MAAYRTKQQESWLCRRKQSCREECTGQVRIVAQYGYAAVGTDCACCRLAEEPSVLRRSNDQYARWGAHPPRLYGKISFGYAAGTAALHAGIARKLRRRRGLRCRLGTGIVSSHPS